ncbi:MAG: hypothetical protein OER86_13455, partial [Phycisphaerae bacterium]|nr:hypothetical protein [Phycisphaerae bacterium]
MNRRTGIADLSQSVDGRLRSLNGALQETTEDPVIPARLVDRYGLRSGLELTVEVGGRRGLESGGGGNRNQKKKKKKK